MRTPKQVKVITSQLEVLEELRVQLGNIETDLVAIIKKGTSWLEETENQSYAEMNHLLSNETVECLRRCLRIGDGNEDLPPFSPTKTEDYVKTASQYNEVLPASFKEDREYQILMERLSNFDKSISLLQESSKHFEENYSKLSQCYGEVNTSVTKNAEKIYAMSEKFDSQEKESKKVSKKLTKAETKNELKFEEIMTQFQAASDYMSELQKQIVQFNLHSSADVLRIQADLEDKIRSILMTQDMAENKFSMRINEIMSAILENTDTVNKMKSQQELVCNQIGENQERINGFEKTLANLQQNVKYYEEKGNTLDEHSTKIEENYRTTFPDIQTINDSLERLQSEHKELSSQMENFRGENSSNDTPIKNDILTKLSTLKSTTDSFIASQTQKTKNVEQKITAVEKKLTSMSTNTDKLSKDIFDLQQNLKDYKENDNALDEHNKNILESYRKTFHEIQTMNVSLERLQSEHKELSSQMDNFRRENSSSNTPIKNDILTKLSTLKSTTDSFIASQTQKTKNVEQKIKAVDKKLTSISTNTDKLSKDIFDFRSKDVSEFFIAQVDVDMGVKNLKKDEIITFFNNVVNAKIPSPNYNTQTGIYTVQHNGLYLICLTVEGLNNVKVKFFVHKKSSSGKENTHGYIHTYQRNFIGTVVFPLPMDKNDQLYVKPSDNFSGVNLGATSFFMCILINKF